ncbi:hypothetical protein LIER_41253 [Lithospermum erythrorhizon]|uniref:Uncharacterized protein n=1 Tax=Lithospermum erythrorhizon TaxID=34254 RepID=A0AAV3R9S8_LITER
MADNSHQETSEVPPRQDSPVVVMDSESLAFCRLYSALGAEVIAGGLRFTPFHDPFANMELSQAVVDDLYRAIHDDPAVEPDQSAPGSNIPTATSSALNPPMARTDGTSPRPAETIQLFHPRTYHFPLFSTDDILRAAKECVEPREVPFSAMAGERRPSFRKVRVKKVSVPSETGSVAVPVDPLTSATPSATQAKKRPNRDGDRPMAFGTRKKHIARRPKRIETITISEDPPSSSPPAPAAPVQEPNPSPAPVPQAPLNLSTSEPQEASSQATSSTEYPPDLFSPPYSLASGLPITEGSTLSKKAEAFQASKPLILERVKKDYDEAENSLEVQAAIARHLIRTLNASYSLATRSQALENSFQSKLHEVSKLNEGLQDENAGLKSENAGLKSENASLKSENEQLKARLLTMQREKREAQDQYIQMGERADEALQKLKEVEESVPFKVEEACRLREKEAIRQYQFSKYFRNEAGRNSAYCLCRFTRTYKDSNPLIVENYKDFIAGYNADWFASCDLEAPLTPEEEDDEEAAPPGDESAV